MGSLGAAKVQVQWAGARAQGGVPAGGGLAERGSADPERPLGYWTGHWAARTGEQT